MTENNPNTSRLLARQTLKWFAVYSVATLFLYGLIGYLVLSQKAQIIDAILSFLMPDSWVPAGSMIVERVFAAHPLMLVNTLMILGLFIAPLFTFPLKEKCSASLEEEWGKAGNPNWTRPSPMSFWRELVMEFVFLTIILSVNLFAWRMVLVHDMEVLALAVSQLAVVIGILLDFVTPTLARHFHSPSTVFTLLFVRKPWYTLFFAVVVWMLTMTFSTLPIITLTPLKAFLSLAMINMGILLIGVIGGTFYGSLLVQTFPTVQAVRPNKLFFWIMYGIVVHLILNGMFFGSLGMKLYHLTPVLKCEWKVIPETFEYQGPTWATPGTALVSFDVEITNPTNRTAAMENHKVNVTHRGDIVAHTRLPEFNVPAGETVRKSIIVEVKADGKGAAKKGVKFLINAKQNGLKEAALDAGRGVIDRNAYGAIVTIPTPTGDFIVEINQPTNGG